MGEGGGGIIDEDEVVGGGWQLSAVDVVLEAPRACEARADRGVAAQLCGRVRLQQQAGSAVRHRHRHHLWGKKGWVQFSEGVLGALTTHHAEKNASFRLKTQKFRREPKKRETPFRAGESLEVLQRLRGKALTVSPTVSSSLCLPLCLSHGVFVTVSVSLCPPHCVSHLVFVTASPTVPDSLCHPLCLPHCVFTCSVRRRRACCVRTGRYSITVRCAGFFLTPPFAPFASCAGFL